MPSSLKATKHHVGWAEQRLTSRKCSLLGAGTPSGRACTLQRPLLTFPLC